MKLAAHFRLVLRSRMMELHPHRQCSVDSCTFCLLAYLRHVGDQCRRLARAVRTPTLHTHVLPVRDVLNAREAVHANWVPVKEYWPQFAICYRLSWQRRSWNELKLERLGNHGLRRASDTRAGREAMMDLIGQVSFSICVCSVAAVQQKGNCEQTSRLYIYICSWFFICAFSSV
jgi:hypothetical protein